MMMQEIFCADLVILSALHPKPKSTGKVERGGDQVCCSSARGALVHQSRAVFELLDRASL